MEEKKITQLLVRIIIFHLLKVVLHLIINIIGQVFVKFFILQMIHLIIINTMMKALRNIRNICVADYVNGCNRQMSSITYYYFDRILLKLLLKYFKYSY